jgi:cysteine desulfurase
MGKKVLYIKADGDGRVSPGQLEKLLGRERNIRMVSVMWVNNETGAVMDIASLSAVCGAQVHFHCDMVQGLGKLPCSIQDMNIDSASMSAHKIGGPRGVGLLYLRKKVQALYSGGEQERGLRPGTENVQGIIACAAALKMRTANISGDFAAAQERMDYLLGKLSMLDRFSPIPRERSIGDARFSPYILQCTLRGIPGEVMVRALDAEGFSISTGSACSSSSPDRPVLKAMGINNTDALEGIRISQGWSTTMEEMDLLVMAIRKILKNL